MTDLRRSTELNDVLKGNLGETLNCFLVWRHSFFQYPLLFKKIFYAIMNTKNEEKKLQGSGGVYVSSSNIQKIPS